MKAFFVAFFSYAAALLISSRDLFTRVIYEEGDSATVSILVLAAKQFDLLLGNYSRVGFHHPGPAVIYVQAFGEWLFYDVLHLVPSPWNGQAIAILLLNAALMALVLSIVFDWFPSWTLMAGLGGVSLLFLTVYNELISSLWMPFIYFAPFLTLLAAVTSVAAGRTKHLWIMALAGGLLVHGHAEFLFFVPLIAGLALVLLWRRKIRPTKRDWWLFGGIIALFLSTIVLNTILNWPGELGKYFSYGGGHETHMPWRAAAYVAQFWGPSQLVGGFIMVALFAGVPFLVKNQTFLKAGVCISAAATVLSVIYAMIGIDHLNERYVGLFMFAVPLFMFFFALIAGSRLVPELKYANVALLVIGIVVSGLSHSLANRRTEMPGIPSTLDAIAAAAGGRPAVLELRPEAAWAEAVPLALSGHRRGIRICLRDPSLELVATAEFMCTPGEISTGVHYAVTRKDAGTLTGQVIGDIGPSVVSR